MPTSRTATAPPPDRPRRAWSRRGLAAVLLVGTLAVLVGDGPRLAGDVHDEPMALRTGSTATGDISLRWSPPDDVARFDIYRAPTGSATPDRPWRSVPGTVEAVADVTWTPRAVYRYQVVARDPDGVVLGTTSPIRVRAPARDTTTSSYVSLTRLRDGTTRAAWRIEESATGPLTLRLARGEPPGRTPAGTVTVEAGTVHGGVVVDGRPTTATLVDGDGRVLATASAAAGLQHPRIGLDDDTVAKIKRVVARPGTPREAWAALTARVGKGPGRSWAGPGRWAREAAFLHVVTGDRHYAEIAYEGFAAAAEELPLDDEVALRTANAVAQLALVYDWASTGWTPGQRATALRTFERTAAYFELLDHPNLVSPDKGSNWVAVVRGAELAQHLAARGDGGYGMRGARIGQLLADLRTHYAHAYSDDGWYQEGLNYSDYESMVAMSGVRASFDAGIDALKDEWYRPDVVGLLLHSVSFRDAPNARLQWGVGTTSSFTALPLYFDRATSPGQLARLVDLFERTDGHRSDDPWYSPGYTTQTLIDWPEVSPDVAGRPPTLPAVLDHEAGSYTFRNRLANEDDVLVNLLSRNSSHLGWSGNDAFAVSMISHGTTWAGQPAKDLAERRRYSRVLVDDTTTQVTGGGSTRAARRYADQGGGYVEMSAPAAMSVDEAVRHAVVDMTDRGPADTVLAFRDHFADAVVHDWTWQLAPQPGVRARVEKVRGDVTQFTLRNGDSWLRAWLLNTGHARATFSDGALQITRRGRQAGFAVVLAVGSDGELPSFESSGLRVRVADARLDLSDLGSYAPGR